MRSAKIRCELLQQLSLIAAESKAGGLRRYPEVRRDGDSVEYTSRIKFRIHPDSQAVMAQLRASGDTCVMFDDQASENASSCAILERIVYGPADEEDMAILEIRHTGPRAMESDVNFAHRSIAEAHIENFAESHGFAEYA